jgi:hypothetical protein
VSEEHEVAGWLLAGATALADGRHETAVRELARVVGHAEFMRAEDMLDLRARALSLYGQALLESGRVRDAEAPVLDAMRALRSLDDEDGLREVRALHRKIRDGMAARARDVAAKAALVRLSRVPLDELRASARSPFALADLLVQRANAEAELGRPAVGISLAEEALQVALGVGDVRLQVLAHLSIARCEPTRAKRELVAALDRADRASEFNMVGAIARAAEVHGVALPEQRGPAMGASRQ